MKKMKLNGFPKKEHMKSNKNHKSPQVKIVLNSLLAFIFGLEELIS